MSSALLIKKLDNSCSRDVIDLILPIQQIEFKVPITLEGQPDLLDIEGFYFAKGGCFWGAWVKGQLAGTIALLAIGHQSGAIRKMFVAKEYRGKELGIASQLLQTLLAFSRDEGFHHLYLGTVNVFSAALRFYEREGFTSIAKKDLPSWFPLMPADNIFYERSLLTTPSSF